jgi:hypothetical protein
MTKSTKVSKVFISHGHSEVAKLKLKGFLQDRLAMKPVILADQPDLGLTVVEKLERYGSECDFALILLTADDQTISGGLRARQNVTHELGFFHGVLGRDKVLLLKQSGVELFSNISGLVYKEFQGDAIEWVFEDIRIALESCSAQRGGSTVPKERNEDLAQSIPKAIDIIAHEWPRMERDRIKQGMQQVVSGLPLDLQVRRIKKFLEDERKEYEARLAQTQAEAQKRKHAFDADPEHGGKMAAMTMSIFESVAPQSALRLIDKLLSEAAFCQTENVKPDVVLDRLRGICDADGQ